MIYGFPQSISDADCDVEPLDPNDPWSIAADAEPSSPGQPTLLEYKCFMLKLSKIIKSTLKDVYGTRRGSPMNTGQGPSRVRDLIIKVTSLDAQLAKWHSELPGKLRLGNLVESVDGKPRSVEYTRASTPAPTFKEQLF
ncbi:hypothetical protein EDB81DRAFT_485666 [Dactylonectria macrodidyma]|uniref:Uncharacterized protein n=1 Tax=Dactylonectria macrodidyma TaxID=307937 RepID=A0A9P9EX27_9HYPO|nr:hypothetical protein EDB81DRAFT_485666 [Dactylonectria macrodidyma]